MKKFLMLLLMLASFLVAGVDLNTASKEELKTLKGIGDAKADAIISARPFKSIDELKNIKGIGDSIYNNIKDQVEVK